MSLGFLASKNVTPLVLNSTILYLTVTMCKELCIGDLMVNETYLTPDMWSAQTTGDDRK